MPITVIPYIPEYITVHLGPPGSRRGERHRLLPRLYQERGFQRDLSHLGASRPAREHPGADLLRAQPGLHGILSQPGLLVPHHEQHRHRPEIHLRPEHLRQHRADRRRHLQYIHSADRLRGAAGREILQRHDHHLRRAFPVGQPIPGSRDGYDSMQILRTYYGDGIELVPDAPVQGVRASYPGSPCAGLRRRGRGGRPDLPQPHLPGLPRHPQDLGRWTGFSAPPRKTP